MLKLNWRSFPEFEAALEGIDGYTHLFVLGYFHKLRPDRIGPLQVKPRRLVNRGFKLEDLPLLGVFALDSPTRPNPIGLTLVRLLERQGRFLKVSGLDFFDGTPIRYQRLPAEYRADDFDLPAWYKNLRIRTDILKSGTLWAASPMVLYGNGHIFLTYTSFTVAPRAGLRVLKESLWLNKLWRMSA